MHPFRLQSLLFLGIGVCCLSGSMMQAADVSFRRDVMAAISKSGCNLGTCHGNATGKGGFKLSLRGQDPAWDYAALTRDISGRRVNTFAADESLLLLKGINKMAHEGGKRLTPGGWEYTTLRDWIASGLPDDATKAPRLTDLRVSPMEQILDNGQSQVQIHAEAIFADGSRQDIAQRAVYEPLQNGLVEVSHDGLVKKLQNGEASVLVRYLDRSIAIRLTFVQNRPDFVWGHPRQENYIDRHIFTKLKSLRVNATTPCSDTAYVRRAWLDLCGFTPSEADAKAFVADQRPDKRARLIDTLLSSQAFADFWSMKWADILKVEGRTLDKKGMGLFHEWIRDAIARNQPMDAFARDIISARGSTYHEATSNFYRANRTPVDRAIATAQVFMGTRLQCAECHNHPFDRWTQDDYYNWAAAFRSIDYKILENKRSDKNDQHEFKGEQVVFLNPKLSVQNPRTGDTAAPRFLGGPAPTTTKDEDELQATADWLTSGANPLFAKSQVNRIWYHLMGRGLVDPVDDFRITNPASHPALLDALAAEFVKSGFDLRHIIRQIMLSRTYQLDSIPASPQDADPINYAFNAPRRLGAEQLYDTLHTALRVRPNFSSGDDCLRVAQLSGPVGGRGSPDPTSAEAFLAEFGRPKRQLSCECERAGETSLSQVIQLMGGPVFQRALTAKYNFLTTLAKRNETPDKMVRTLYWTLLTREPTAAELAAMADFLTKAKDPRLALEDITWSLVNAKEFILRR